MIKINRPDRTLPPDLDKKAQEIESEGWIQYLMRRFEKAEGFYGQDLDLRYKFQEQSKRPVHKGAPLHMLGICSLYQGKTDQSITCFLRAYAEDTLLFDYDDEDEADRLAAASALRDTISVRMRLFREVKSVSRDLKLQKWATLSDPDEIVKPSLDRMGLSLDKVSELKHPNVMLRLREKTPLGFPQPVEFRVFIGGKYGGSDEVIEKVREIVLRLGMTPIVAREVETPRERTHEFAARLLHTCSFAIFDMSVPGGQYMEIERATDYGVKMLLIHKKGTQISTMASTALGVKGVFEFETVDDLYDRISKFLVIDPSDLLEPSWNSLSRS